MPRPVPPLRLREQFGFLARFTPLLGLALVGLLFQVWKGIETDALRSQVYHAARRCASLDGVRQQEDARRLTLTAYARLEPAAAALGLAWPEQASGRIIVAAGRMEHADPETAQRLPLREETACAR
jgi:hypothetical protein